MKLNRMPRFVLRTARGGLAAGLLAMSFVLPAGTAEAQSRIEMRARDVRALSDFTSRFQRFVEPVLAAASAAQNIENLSADVARGTIPAGDATARASALRAAGAAGLAEIERMIGDGQLEVPRIQDAAMRDAVVAMREGAETMRASAQALLAGAWTDFETGVRAGARTPGMEALAGMLEIERVAIGLTNAAIWPEHPQRSLNETVLALNGALLALLRAEASGGFDAATVAANIQRGETQAREIASQVEVHARTHPQAREIAQGFESVYRESFEVERALAEAVGRHADGRPRNSPELANLRQSVAPLLDRRVALYAGRVRVVNEVERMIR